MRAYGSMAVAAIVVLAACTPAGEPTATPTPAASVASTSVAASSPSQSAVATPAITPAPATPGVVAAMTIEERHARLDAADPQLRPEFLAVTSAMEGDFTPDEAESNVTAMVEWGTSSLAGVDDGVREALLIEYLALADEALTPTAAQAGIDAAAAVCASMTDGAAYLEAYDAVAWDLDEDPAFQLTRVGAVSSAWVLCPEHGDTYLDATAVAIEQLPAE